MIMELAPPLRVLWTGDPVWLAPICAVKKPNPAMGVVIFELVLGEYLQEWTTTPRSPKEMEDEE